VVCCVGRAGTLVACRRGSWKRKHSIQRDLRPVLSVRVDDDLVDDITRGQALERPHQVRKIDAIHGRAETDSLV